MRSRTRENRVSYDIRRGYAQRPPPEGGGLCLFSCGSVDDVEHRRVELDVAGGAPERDARTEGEDATVAGRHPVAGAVGRDQHGDHGLVELQVTGRPTEHRAAEGEDAAVLGGQVIALAIGRRAQVDDGSVELGAAHRAEEAG